MVDELNEIKRLVGGENFLKNFKIKSLKSLKNSTLKDINKKRSFLRFLNLLELKQVANYLEFNFVKNHLRINDVDFFNLVNRGFLFEISDNSLFINDFEGFRLLTDRCMKNSFLKICPHFHFWFSDLKANNLKSFIFCLQKISLKTFKHHYENMDFFKWLKQFELKDLDNFFKKVPKDYEMFRKDLISFLIER